MTDQQKAELLLEVAENIWEGRNKIAQEILEASKPIIEEAVNRAIEEAGGIEGEREAVAQKIIEHYTEFLRRGINRGTKRTAKELGRE